jgi:hypothetical protein
MRRIINPGRYLVITYLGQNHAQIHLKHNDYSILLSKGIIVTYPPANSWNGVYPQSFPDTFHLESYIHENYSPSFNDIEFEQYDG